MHHEAELAIVVGTVSRRVAEDASRHIIGYTAANDVSARDICRRRTDSDPGEGLRYLLSARPAIETEVDPIGLRITCSVNDELRQDASTDDMVFGVAEIFAFVTRVMTLLPVTSSSRELRQVSVRFDRAIVSRSRSNASGH